MNGNRGIIACARRAKEGEKPGNEARLGYVPEIRCPTIALKLTEQLESYLVLSFYGTVLVLFSTFGVLSSRGERECQA